MRSGDQSLVPFLDWLPLEKAKVLEIGSFAGDGTVQLLKSDKVASVTCVDLYSSGYDKDDTASNSDMSEAMIKWMAQVIAANTERKPVTLCAYQNLKCQDWASYSFDLIYIDASHLYEDVMHDINRALMLQPNIIAGHDYGQAVHPGVKEAVDSFFAEEILHTFKDSSWAVKL